MNSSHVLGTEGGCTNERTTNFYIQYLVGTRDRGTLDAVTAIQKTALLRSFERTPSIAGLWQPSSKRQLKQALTQQLVAQKRHLNGAEGLLAEVSFTKF